MFFDGIYGNYVTDNVVQSTNLFKITFPNVLLFSNKKKINK